VDLERSLDWLFYSCLDEVEPLQNVSTATKECYKHLNTGETHSSR
jgi:hypothetical protein